MPDCPWAIRELVPHSGDKVLLDRVRDYDSESLQAEATVKADSVYLKGAAEPAWMGLEYMSQAIAAFAGIRERERGFAPKVGMLIGTRRYSSSFANFPVGMTLQVEVRVLLEDENGLSVFQSRITADDQVAEANLNVYQPRDINHYLEEKK